MKNTFKVLTNFSNVEQLANIKEDELKVYSFSQQEVYGNPDHAFLISNNSAISKAIKIVDKI